MTKIKIEKKVFKRNNWRAGYIERCKSGFGGGHTKTYFENEARRWMPTLLRPGKGKGLARESRIKVDARRVLQIRRTPESR